MAHKYKIGDKFINIPDFPQGSCATITRLHEDGTYRAGESWWLTEDFLDRCTLLSKPRIKIKLKLYETS